MKKSIDSINSSKVYCKFISLHCNSSDNLSINSSKVYCKYKIVIRSYFYFLVLIVAKCIVNAIQTTGQQALGMVLIVAKCIVNTHV